MDQSTQTLLALGLVFAALGYLLWRWLGRRRGSACEDSGCGCDKRVLKKRNRK